MKHIKDELYDTLSKEPTKENLRQMLQKNDGETDNLDFKETWVDGPHLAKTLLAMGNSHGGMICVGIKENDDGTLLPIGIEQLKDKSVIADSVSKYIPADLDYQVFDYSYSTSDYKALEGKKFQLLIVHDTPDRLPFISVKASASEIEKDVIYVRRGTKCEKANANDIERIIEERISSISTNSYEMTLSQHLDQLKTLFGELPQRVKVLVSKGEPTGFELAMKAIGRLYRTNDVYEEKDNPYYPQESYEAFILRAIERKKIRIEKELGIK